MSEMEQQNRNKRKIRIGRGNSERLSLLEMRLDFNFPAQLMFQAFLLYLGLEQDFQGHDEMVFLQASQVHIPKFSLAERTPDFKIINCETPPDRKESRAPRFQRWVESQGSLGLAFRFYCFHSPGPSARVLGP